MFNKKFVHESHVFLPPVEGGLNFRTGYRVLKIPVMGGGWGNVLTGELEQEPHFVS